MPPVSYPPVSNTLVCSASNNCQFVEIPESLTRRQLSGPRSSPYTSGLSPPLSCGGRHRKWPADRQTWETIAWIDKIEREGCPFHKCMRRIGMATSSPVTGSAVRASPQLMTISCYPAVSDFVVEVAWPHPDPLPAGALTALWMSECCSQVLDSCSARVCGQRKHVQTVEA